MTTRISLDNIQSASLSGLGGSGGVSWQATQTSDFTASAGNGYPIDTTSNAVTITLPASPSDGDVIAFVDVGDNLTTNMITIGVNGNKVNAKTTDIPVFTNKISVILRFLNSTVGWVIESIFGTNLMEGGYDVEYLAIGGGGGGNGGTSGVYFGSGGAAGALRAGNKMLVPGTSYNIAIGAGSSGTISSTPAQGGSTIFDDVTATGGGGGIHNTGYGGSNTDYSGAAPTGGTAAGGGAGAAGNGSGQNGGAAASSNITGSIQYYGGGGAGVAGGAAGTPGTGGGGLGGSGSANTGSGGGGYDASHTAGSGGSGVVILAYTSNFPDISVSAGLTYTVDTLNRVGYKVYKFTAGTGTIQF